MANVVVYLKARDEQRLVDAGHRPAEWVREQVRRALDGDLDGDGPDAPGSAGMASGGGAVSTQEHFRPDFGTKLKR